MEILAFRLLHGAIIGYILGALAGGFFFRHGKAARIFSFGFATIASLAGLVAAILVLSPHGSLPFNFCFDLFPSPIPFLKFSIQLDPLSAFFVLIVSLLGIALSIYSLGYVREFDGRKNVGLRGLFYDWLRLSILLVFCASNVFFFLVVWELMSLAAFFLVCYEHEKAESRSAGILFFIMSHIGTGCIILGFLILFKATGQFAFTDFHAIGASLSPSTQNAAFLLFLIGFGVKAGIIPLHVWLPAAHPVAPSNVSALMSGVMIKTGIYGLVRVCFDFLGPPPMWWGVTVLIIGIVSALLGVLYALVEHDLKRLLAFSSIENIGIILLGIGSALLFQATHHSLLAAMALTAGLLHAINHATFKGLLFLGAGAVLHAAHTRNMEELGGLIRRMPRTAFFFLMGAIAISGLPLLNGFVSEWLTYQSLLRGYEATQSLACLLFPISGSLLALVGALAAACFVKAFGITFLAQGRSSHAKEAHEVCPTMLWGMGILTASCFVLGLFPSVFFTIFDPITKQLLQTRISPQLTLAGGFSISPLNLQAGTVSPIGIFTLLLVLLPIPIGLRLIFGRRTKIRMGPTWDCGLKGLTPQMEYTATAFSKPLQLIFRALYRASREIQADFEFSRYFTKTIHFESHIEPTFERWIYQPFHDAVLKISKKFRWVQAGSIHVYLLYIFLTLLFLLLWTRS